jgi:Ca2+-binding EF-hand superfamily protein
MRAEEDGGMLRHAEHMALDAAHTAKRKVEDAERSTAARIEATKAAIQEDGGVVVHAAHVARKAAEKTKQVVASAEHLAEKALHDKALALLDADGDGQVSVREIKAFARREVKAAEGFGRREFHAARDAATAVERAVADKALEILDGDGDGKVSLREIKAFARKEAKAAKEAALTAGHAVTGHERPRTLGSGIAAVRVLRARGLPREDATGSSDPYVVLSWGAQSYRTKAVERCLNPDFDPASSRFLFAFPSWDAFVAANVQVRVMDRDRIGADDLMGEGALGPLSVRVNGSPLRAPGSDPDEALPRGPLGEEERTVLLSNETNGRDSGKPGGTVTVAVEVWGFSAQQDVVGDELDRDRNGAERSALRKTAGAAKSFVKREATKATAAAKRVTKKAVEIVDADGDGKVSLAEAKSFVKREAAKATAAAKRVTEKAVGIVDADGDGKVSLAEAKSFVKREAAKVTAAAKRAKEKAGGLVDADGDGKISLAEAKTFVKREAAKAKEHVQVGVDKVRAARMRDAEGRRLTEERKRKYLEERALARKIAREEHEAKEAEKAAAAAAAKLSRAIARAAKEGLKASKRASRAAEEARQTVEGAVSRTSADALRYAGRAARGAFLASNAAGRAFARAFNAVARARGDPQKTDREILAELAAAQATGFDGSPNSRARMPATAHPGADPEAAAEEVRDVLASVDGGASRRGRPSNRGGLRDGGRRARGSRGGRSKKTRARTSSGRARAVSPTRGVAKKRPAWQRSSNPAPRVRTLGKDPLNPAALRYCRKTYQEPYTPSSDIFFRRTTAIYRTRLPRDNVERLRTAHPVPGGRIPGQAAMVGLSKRPSGLVHSARPHTAPVPVRTLVAGSRSVRSSSVARPDASASDDLVVVDATPPDACAIVLSDDGGRRPLIHAMNTAAPTPAVESSEVAATPEIDGGEALEVCGGGRLGLGRFARQRTAKAVESAKQAKARAREAIAEAKRRTSQLLARTGPSAAGAKDSAGEEGLSEVGRGRVEVGKDGEEEQAGPRRGQREPEMKEAKVDGNEIEVALRRKRQMAAGDDGEDTKEENRSGRRSRGESSGLRRRGVERNRVVDRRESGRAARPGRFSEPRRDMRDGERSGFTWVTTRTCLACRRRFGPDCRFCRDCGARLELVRRLRRGTSPKGSRRGSGGFDAGGGSVYRRRPGSNNRPSTAPQRGALAQISRTTSDHASKARARLIRAGIADGDLPPGWTASRDPSTGKTFYYSEKGARSWRRPRGGQGASLPPESAANGAEGRTSLVWRVA